MARSCFDAVPMAHGCWCNISQILCPSMLAQAAQYCFLVMPSATRSPLAKGGTSRLVDVPTGHPFAWGETGQEPHCLQAKQGAGSSLPKGLVGWQPGRSCLSPTKGLVGIRELGWVGLGEGTSVPPHLPPLPPQNSPCLCSRTYQPQLRLWDLLLGALHC